MIAAAIFLAAGSSNQDTTPPPQQAIALATLLHTTPTATPTLTLTPTPTLTLTPVPTVTPIPGWTRVESIGIQIWVPPLFTNEAAVVPKDVQVRESGTILNEAVIVCAACPRGNESNPSAPYMNWPAETIRLIEVRKYSDPDLFPYTIANLGFYDFRPERSRLVNLGRYQAYRTVLSGPAMDGSALSKLMYWIEVQDKDWVMIFTAPGQEFERRLDAFEEIARSVTILQ